MLYEIYDKPEEKAISIVFDFENGLALSVDMEDEAAQQLVDIIQNKLNARC